jgi:hypothetical protein
MYLILLLCIGSGQCKSDMYMYLILLLCIGSGQWSARYVQAHRANGPTRHDLYLCVPGLDMSLGTWASTTRPEALTGRAWPDTIRTGPKRVWTGSVPGGPFGHLYPGRPYANLLAF